jgi:hypothetical protein
VVIVNRNVELPDIGTFYFTAEEKLVFVPYLSINFDTASFGLPKLRLKTIDQQAAISTNPTTISPEPALHAPETPATLAAPVTLEQSAEEPDITIPEVVKPTAKVERNKKNIALQEKKAKSKTKSTKTRLSTLGIVNVLGSIFLLALVLTMFNFERGNNQNTSLNLEIASLLDSPQTTEVAKTSPHIVSFGIYAQVDTEQEANQLSKELAVKYSNTAINRSDSGPTEVFIISFTNESLTQEYKNLLQNKLNQKLVIKQK